MGAVYPQSRNLLSENRFPCTGPIEVEVQTEDVDEASWIVKCRSVHQIRHTWSSNLTTACGVKLVC